MKIKEETLPGDETNRVSPANYLGQFNAYMAQRIAHRKTENIPAPFPPHEFMRVIAERIERENDTPLEIELKPIPPLPPVP